MQDKKIRTGEKSWVFRSQPAPGSERAVSEIAANLGVNRIIAKLLYCRGYTTPAMARDFLTMESEMLRDPFKMKGVNEAIARIRQAVDAGEKITVYGDYDVDGVTAVCTLYLYLRSIGARVDYYIPNRVGEGYGVSVAAIDAIKATDTTLVITVDTGITAIEEVEYARGLGIDFVITDHHECRPELPLAVAIVNPHQPDCGYPFKELAGVGVVFKLITAYEEKRSGKSRVESAAAIFSQYSDLVAIGTIADVMPIKDENRIIVSHGLKMMEVNRRPGLSALIEASVAARDNHRTDRAKKPTKITSGYIGYTLAPRINAAGRIRSASMAVELFLSDDYSETVKIAEALCDANKERQNEENSIMKEAYEKIEQLDVDKDPVIVLDSDNWHHGVIGIVASRITEKYGRPCILISFEGNTGGDDAALDIGKGSGRSIKGMNLVEALSHCEEYIVKFGGHELAAGLSVSRKNLPDFRRKINEYARGLLSAGSITPTLEADFELDYQSVTFDLARQLRILEPYGVGNPVPAFVMRGVTVAEVVGIGEGKHTRLVLTDGKSTLTAMYFSNSPESLGVYPSDSVDIMFNIDINEWMGRQSVQLVVRDVRHTSSQAAAEKSDRERFDEIWNGAPIEKDEDVIPSRDEFAAVYRLMLSSVHSGVNKMTHREILSKLSSIGVSGLNYIKLKVIIKVFLELNIADITELEPEVYTYRIQYTTSKTDLDKSWLLKRLRKQVKY